MKKLLLLFTLGMSSVAYNLQAQETTLEVYDDAIFYSMYEGLVDQPLPPGAQRNHNSSYSVKLTDEQIATFGNTLTLNVQASSLCDNYDRIGSVGLAFVTRGATSYDYRAVRKIELGRFITPFMLPARTLEVPYTFDITNVLDILHDPALTAQYDFWVEFQIEGYQGGPGQGGAAEQYPSICAGRNDVYRGSVQFVSSGTYVPKNTYFKELSYRYELKNYVQATNDATYGQGTDVVGQTVRSLTFNVDRPVKNTKFYIITSNHGSNSGGEEYVRRWHYVFLDGVEKLRYRPGGKSCEPYRQYNTQGNGIYGATPMTLAEWTSFNNWCPGDAVPIRTADLGVLAAGDYTYKITVPDARFTGSQGYFPMSVFVQGEYETTASNDEFVKTEFYVLPNPVNDIATIKTNSEPVKSYSVINTLGQVVVKGAGETINMASLENGIYIVKAEFANGGVQSQKVVKK